MHKSIIIYCAFTSSFFGEKSIRAGAPCPCIVVTGTGTWVAWLLKGLNIRYNREIKVKLTNRRSSKDW